MPEQATRGPGDEGKSPGPGGPVWISPFRIGVAVVLVVAALVAWALTGSAAATYRTATVGTGTVEATLESVGTITPVNQADLNFNASGTVSTVDVAVGQSVTAGQTLASLDITTLDAAVTTAQASVASAQATLASAEASETSSTTSSPAASTTSTSTSGQSTGNTGQIEKLQAALTTAQTAADNDSSQASAALTAATTLCADSAPATTTTTTTTPSTTTTTTAAGPAVAGPDASPGAGAGSGATGGSGDDQASPTTCSQALSQASSAQSAVSADLKSVAAAESALNAALTSGSSGSGSSASAGASSASSKSGGSGTGSGSGSSSSKVASAQQLAVDQASVDTAQAKLADAQQALGGANLVTTISGTIASVSIAPGDSVTAGSSTSPEIVVIGGGTSYDVSTTIPVADIGQVSVGQQAVITPDSTNEVEDGLVSSIGVLATSSTSTTSYPVTISLDSSGLGQLSGADASVSIVVKKSADVTTVPSSAVRTIGTIHLVTVVDGNAPKEVRVTLGTVGAILTQVKSGVSPGETVSLADLAEPLPSTSTTTRTGTGLGGAAGFGGTGFGGAGFGGGGFGGGGFRAGGIGG